MSKQNGSKQASKQASKTEANRQAKRPPELRTQNLEGNNYGSVSINPSVSSREHRWIDTQITAVAAP